LVGSQARSNVRIDDHIDNVIHSTMKRTPAPWISNGKFSTATLFPERLPTYLIPIRFNASAGGLGSKMAPGEVGLCRGAGFLGATLGSGFGPPIDANFDEGLLNGLMAERTSIS
jgi:hypothetical protein